jgi:glycosyltransferase involved in cell wall biosynthesis
MQPSDVSVVVCTMNSISGIHACLSSLRDAGVGELIVVDAHSNDGTRDVANELADLVLEDPGLGLGNARNVGIAQTFKPLILNMGSDNIMPPGQLQRMIDTLIEGSYAGVSARTWVEGDDFVSRGLRAWRQGRFRAGPVSVIGTPSLFVGEMLRSSPYDATRMFSDDSELCERWSRTVGARFAIADADVLEVGKATWREVVVRCRMYGISDNEVFRKGRSDGWRTIRAIESIAHPLRADFIAPMSQLPPRDAVANTPFLAAFTALRYIFWAGQALK